MSCLGLLSPQQRAALAASSAAGPSLSSFGSPPTSPGKVQRLRLLARSEEPRIRESAALSFHSPPDVLAALAQDPVASVRACVARNQRADLDLLWALSDDPDAVVRGWVAAHPHVPVDLLTRLRGDRDAQVRAVVRWAHGWRRPTGTSHSHDGRVSHDAECSVTRSEMSD